jgi:hypothetical protein
MTGAPASLPAKSVKREDASSKSQLSKLKHSFRAQALNAGRDAGAPVTRLQFS